MWADDQSPLSCNAYLGAFPIARALDAGAQIVVTGRCVDSAIVLGPLDSRVWLDAPRSTIACLPVRSLDILSSAVRRPLAATSPIGAPRTPVRSAGDTWAFRSPSAPPTDRLSSPSRAPLADSSRASLSPSSSSTRSATPPATFCPTSFATGATSSSSSRSASIVSLVRGARGRAPPEQLKVCATVVDGFQAAAILLVPGDDAAERARAVGDAVCARANMALASSAVCRRCSRRRSMRSAPSRSLAPTRQTRRRARSFCVSLRVTHRSRASSSLCARWRPPPPAWRPASRASAADRRTPRPACASCRALCRAAPCLSRSRWATTVCAQSVPWSDETSPARDYTIADSRQDASPARAVRRIEATATRRVPLHALCVARSGDKGDTANIGVVARDPRHFELIGALSVGARGAAAHGARAARTSGTLPDARSVGVQLCLHASARRRGRHVVAGLRPTGQVVRATAALHTSRCSRTMACSSNL
jgi:hypothetical protein